MSDNPYNLARFVFAQRQIFRKALGELKRGRKHSHWMWFIFPQIHGLGSSPESVEFAVKSLAEARSYLAHPILGKRLIECAEAVLAVEGSTALEIMGRPDDLKLKSSMTLFERAAGQDSVFAKLLDKYYAGERDEKTLAILGAE
jgi:uncharacterized protein (DUF1810 family)